MTTLYKNSGSHGDLVYSLCVIPKLGPGTFLFPINNLANECKKYHAQKVVDLQPIHRDYFTEEHFNMFLPLLKKQPYIEEVLKWTPGTPVANGPWYDTDKFRGIFGKRICNNYMTMFYECFNIEFKKEDHNVPWLTAGKQYKAPIVICRTERYRFPDDHGNQYYRKMHKEYNLTSNAVFIGSEREHYKFQLETGVEVKRELITDFLEFAEIINAAETFVGNQTFGLSLATGLGKTTYTEVRPVPHPSYNECFWEFRKNSFYF